MVSLLLGSVLFPAAVRAAGTNDFGVNWRVVNGTRVDITPVVQWFKAHSAEHAATADESRPYKAWHLISVTQLTQSAGEWLAQGRIDGKVETVVLEHPPRKEWEEFKQLKPQHDALVVRTNQLQKALQKATKSRQQAATHEQALLHGRHTPAQLVVNQRQLRDRSVEESALAGDLEKARQQLAQLDAKGYDLQKPFVMNCLAFRTGQKRAGHPVYDRGVLN
jgi:hypothetical protein